MNSSLVFRRYRLVNAHRLIQLLHNIHNLCRARGYNAVTDVSPHSLPYLPQGGVVTFFVYFRDYDDRLYKLVRRARDECWRSKGQVVDECGQSSRYVESFSVKVRVVKKPDDESLMMPPLPYVTLLR